MKLKLHHLLFLVFLIESNIYGQKTDVLNFEKVYSFLNSTMTSDTVKFNLSDRTNFGVFNNDTTSIFADTLFDNTDKEYFRKQFSMLDTIKWRENNITGATIITQKDLKKVFKRKNGWDKYRKKYGACLTEFSLPIFNKNYEYCIFYRWTQCGYLVGSGSINLYKFVNGKWIFIKSYMSGLS